MNAADTDDELTEWFYPNHLGKLLLFGLVGGSWFLWYWSYRSWKAYVENKGYSRATFWRSVEKATGYRPSAFWRALLHSSYALCLFPAVDRECRARKVRGLPGAELWALALGVLLYFHNEVPGLVGRCAVSPVWAVVPAQLGINRLQKKAGHRVRFRTSGWELVWLALGAYLQLRH